jgi:hypothetical protein
MGYAHEAGKGSRDRGDKKKYEEGWDRIFAKKCIKKCSLGPDNVCTGCKRTIDEIKEAGTKAP